MLRAGQPATDFVDSAVRHVLLRQGVLGVKVSILLPSSDPTIKGAVNKQLPDVVIVREPKAEDNVPLVPTGTPGKGYEPTPAGGAPHGAGPREDFGRFQQQDFPPHQPSFGQHGGHGHGH